MIGIIVPAHDEEERITTCMQSLRQAAIHPGLAGEAVEIIVVLDACHDNTGALARQLGARTIALSAKNVGLARRAGATAALASGARWLAFTDADSVVAPDWLAAQLALDADVVCGTIAVEDWGVYGERMNRHFELTYKDAENHSHIHGANLGVSAQAYAQAGGFAALPTGEDVALVEALRANKARIAWSSAPRVVTSVRPNFKAPDGFGATLAHIHKLRLWAGADLGMAA
jgi:glycosyltransferase involved in cell wall biosynthesis